MARIAKRIVKGNVYYYLEESIKKGTKWIKESVYLGKDFPDNIKLAEIYKKFEETLELKGISGITPPFTECITRHLAIKIEKAIKDKILFLNSLSSKQRIEFIRRERITFVTDSNAIEGSTLDYWLTERILSDQKRIECCRNEE